MQFAVIGLGNFGFHLAKTLYERGHEVLAVDTDEEVIARIRDFASKAIIADATDRRALVEIGIRDIDVAVISLGQKMETSLLVALHLKELGVPRIYVKAITEDHGRVLELMGITEVIFPERDMAVRLAHRLTSPNLIDYLPVATGYTILEIAVPDSFLGKTLRELDLRKEYEVQVLAIRELIPERVTLIPPADFVLKDSDTLIIMGKDADLERLQTAS